MIIVKSKQLILMCLCPKIFIALVTEENAH